MAPRRNSYDSSSSFLDIPRDSMSPKPFQATRTPPSVRYPRRLRSGQTAKRQTNNTNGNSGNSSSSGNSSNSGNSGNSGNGSDGNSSSSKSPSSSKSGSQNNNPFNCPICTIRDNDPRVYYHGSWTLNGTQVSTTHSTTLSGSSVSLRFNGSGIIVFGTVPASNETFPPPTTVYFLDDNKPFQTTLPFALVNVPNQPLFASSGSLSSDKEHQISINITSASAPYILEKFFVFPKASSTKDMIGQLPTGATVLPTGNISDVPPSPSPQAASPSASHTSYDPQTTIKVLASLLGILVLLIATGVVFYVFRRRMLATHEVAEEKIESGRPETVYTSFTSTESILRHDSSIFSPSRSPRTSRTQFSRSEGRSGRSPSEGRLSTIRLSTIDFVPPPPLPPKLSIFISSPGPG
ncbi:hypothetical protein BDZ97DRAFT_295509 [Flammula alnicola]|nr:hypothetical protein BDZ97DRAFT_295509 [Flammula alnicola]